MGILCVSRPPCEFRWIACTSKPVRDRCVACDTSVHHGARVPSVLAHVTWCLLLAHRPWCVSAMLLVSSQICCTVYHHVEFASSNLPCLVPALCGGGETIQERRRFHAIPAVAPHMHGGVRAWEVDGGWVGWGARYWRIVGVGCWLSRMGWWGEGGGVWLDYSSSRQSGIGAHWESVA